MLYAVGDIHGQLGKLDALLEKLPLRPDDHFVFLGDYIDRGPDSFGVVERLLELKKRYNCIFLMGNHESMFLHFLGWSGPRYFAGNAFLANGGEATLRSYRENTGGAGSDGSFELPASHIRFFDSLRLSFQGDAYVFAHAGLGRPTPLCDDVEEALRRAEPRDLLWDRAHMERSHKLGVTIIYGHTPKSDYQLRWNYPFSIGIDTGAAYEGPLTAIALPDETIYQSHHVDPPGDTPAAP